MLGGFSAAADAVFAVSMSTLFEHAPSAHSTNSIGVALKLTANYPQFRKKPVVNDLAQPANAGGPSRAGLEA